MFKIETQIQPSILQNYQCTFGHSFAKMNEFSKSLFLKQKNIIAELEENKLPPPQEEKMNIMHRIISPNQKIQELKQIFAEFGEECKSEWVAINQELLAIIKQIVTIYQLKVQSLQSQILEEKSNNQSQKAENESLQEKLTKYQKNQYYEQAQKGKMYNINQDTISYHKNKIQTEEEGNGDNIVEYDGKITQLFSEEFTDLFSPNDSVCEIQTGNKSKYENNALAQKKNTLSMKENHQENKSKSLNSSSFLLKALKNQLINEHLNQTYRQDDHALENQIQRKKVQKSKTSILSSCKRSVNRDTYECSISSKLNQLRRNLFTRKTYNQ